MAKKQTYGKVVITSDKESTYIKSKGTYKSNKKNIEDRIKSGNRYDIRAEGIKQKENEEYLEAQKEEEKKKLRELQERELMNKVLYNAHIAIQRQELAMYKKKNEYEDTEDDEAEDIDIERKNKRLKYDLYSINKINRL